MEVKLTEIVDAIAFQPDEARSLINIVTGEVAIFSDEEINAADRDDDLSEHADWYKEAVARAKEYLENEENYIHLPSKYDFHEYRVMEKFISTVPMEEQREELFNLIKGRGAFSRFRQGLERFLLIDKWHQYRDHALAEFAKRWCQDNEIKYKE